LKRNLYIIITAFLFSSILWISITLTEEYYSTYKIPINTVNVPYGYTLASELPSDISLKIRGIGWRLTGIALGSESVFNVSAKNDSGKILANLYANVVENPWLSSDISVIDISPDTVSFLIERIVSKKLRVIPDIDISFKTGFGLGSRLKVTPDSVIVSGPKSIMEHIDSFYTLPVRLSSLDERTKVKATFDNNMFKTNIPAVEISLDVQRIMDKTFDDIKVVVIDVPLDRDVVLLPNSISCIVKGGINVLGKLNAEDFNAIISYRDILLDTLGSVQPELVIPDNVELVAIKPGRLRYIIKKFD
jgi:hypothetical protein